MPCHPMTDGVHAFHGVEGYALEVGGADEHECHVGDRGGTCLLYADLQGAGQQDCPPPSEVSVMLFMSVTPVTRQVP